MMTNLDRLANYAQTHDFPAEMAEGVWETDVEPDPMVTTSLRLPASLLAWVRAQAAEQHVRPTALIRQWIEQHRDAAGKHDPAALAARVDRLEGVVSRETRAG